MKLRYIALFTLLFQAVALGQLTKLGVSKTGGTMTGELNFSGTGHYGLEALSLTTTQRDALTPANGNFFYNSTTGQFQFRENSAWATLGGAGGGAVSSVGLSVPASLFNVSGSPITSSGTFSLSFATGQTANYVFGTNSSGAVSLQALTADHIPSLAITKLSAIADSTVVGNTSGASAVPQALTLGKITGDGTIIIGSGNKKIIGGNLSITSIQPLTTTSTPTHAGANLSTGTTTLGVIAGTIDGGSATSFEVPNAAAPTVDAVGEVALDNDRIAASKGALMFYDGTNVLHAVGMLNTDNPVTGDYPSYQSNNTVTWEAATSVNVGLNSVPYFSTANTAMASAFSWNSTVGRLYGAKEGHFTSDSDTLKLGMNQSEYFFDAEFGNASLVRMDTSGRVYSALGFDAIGATSLQVGSVDVTSITLSTDATGTGEVVLPDGAIGSLEIADNAVLEADLSSSDAFTDEDIVTLEGTTDFEYHSIDELLARGYKYRTTDTTTTSSTFGNLGNLWHTVTSGSYYTFEAVLIFQSSSLTCGLKLALTHPGVATLEFAASAEIASQADGGNAAVQGHISVSGDSVSASTVEATGTSYIATIRGNIKPNATGPIQIRFANDDNANTITIKAGSSFLIRKVN